MALLQLLLQISAIVLAGRLLARALRPLGQPAVIAEIVAGIVLGPSALGAVFPGTYAAIFPPESLPALGLVANLGLVFFMFLVGLEFHPRLLQGQARSSIAVSVAGMVVPFALGIGLAAATFGDLGTLGQRWLPFALFLGTAMSVTAFPVLARILAERRLLQTRVGAMALASAAVGDVVAWCVLALVVAVAQASGLGDGLRTTAYALGYCGLCWFGLRPILERIGPRGDVELSTDVVALIFLLLLGSASVTEVIGIHALFGAFLVGACMPRRGSLQRVMADKMEDFVTIALLPLFFAYSGLRTEIGLVHGTRDWVLCGIVFVVACVGKFGGAAVAGRLAGLPFRDAAALGVLMNTRGLMELVVLNVGLDLGVISPKLFTMMVLMALATTWIASPILALLYREERDEAADEEAVPTIIPEAPGGILVCISDPAMAGPLVTVAAACRGTAEPVAALHLLPTERPVDYLRGPATEDEGPLPSVVAAGSRRAIEVETMSFPSARPGDDIVRVAEERHAAMVLVGVHRSTLGRDSLGGVVGAVLSSAPCPVGILVDHGLLQVRTIALDLPDPVSSAAVDLVRGRLERAGVRVVKGEAAATADLVLRPASAGVPGRGPGPSVLLLADATTPRRA